MVQKNAPRPAEDIVELKRRTPKVGTLIEYQKPWQSWRT